MRFLPKEEGTTLFVPLPEMWNRLRCLPGTQQSTRRVDLPPVPRGRFDPFICLGSTLGAASGPDPLRTPLAYRALFDNHPSCTKHALAVLRNMMCWT